MNGSFYEKMANQPTPPPPELQDFFDYVGSIWKWKFDPLICIMLWSEYCCLNPVILVLSYTATCKEAVCLFSNKEVCNFNFSRGLFGQNVEECVCLKMNIMSSISLKCAEMEQDLKCSYSLHQKPYQKLLGLLSMMKKFWMICLCRSCLDDKNISIVRVFLLLKPRAIKWWLLSSSLVMHMRIGFLLGCLYMNLLLGYT